MSPFKAVYGREPPSILDYVPMSATTYSVDNLLKDRQELLQELKKKSIKSASINEEVCRWKKGRLVISNWRLGLGQVATLQTSFSG